MCYLLPFYLTSARNSPNTSLPSHTDSDSAVLFYVHPTSGRLSCNYLDYELKKYHVINVHARCHGNSLGYADKQIRVTVVDVNDNKPRLLLSSPRTFNVSTNAPYNATVVTLRASDDDSDLNGLVFFRYYYLLLLSNYLNIYL